MNFKAIIDQVPDIKVKQFGKLVFDITTVQRVLETKNKIIVQCAEYIDEFKRGYICDFDFEYSILKLNEDEDIQDKLESQKDLVLVYINKTWELNSFPIFEYVFFK